MTMKPAARLPATIRASEFKAKCLDVMDRVAETGQSIVVTKRGVPVARVTPIVERPATLRGFFGQPLEIASDIVGPLEADWHAER